MNLTVDLRVTEVGFTAGEVDSTIAEVVLRVDLRVTEVDFIADEVDLTVVAVIVVVVIVTVKQEHHSQVTSYVHATS